MRSWNRWLDSYPFRNTAATDCSTSRLRASGPILPGKKSMSPRNA